MRKQGNQKKSGKQRIVMVRDSYHLPPIDVAFKIRRSFRYVVNAAVQQQNITAANILDTICFATTATAASQLFELVRVRRIQAMAMGDGQTPTSVIIYLPGPQEVDGQYRSDTSMSIDPARLDIKPSSRSLVGFWQPTGTNVLMQLTLPAGTVFQLDLDLQTSLGGAAVAVGASVTGATAGVIYQRGIDNLPKATTKFYPQVPDAGVI
jgi:hypothetical protein